MADEYTTLNLPTVPGGDVMDESGIVYGSAPTLRKRPRVVITGEGIDDISEVVGSDPSITSLGLVTRQVQNTQAHPGDAVVSVGSATLVPYNTETTVVSYTVPTGKTFYLVGFIGSGDINGRFYLYLNGVLKFVLRSTVASLNVETNNLIIRPTAGEAEVVRLSITHFQNGLLGTFEGTVLGYLV